MNTYHVISEEEKFRMQDRLQSVFPIIQAVIENRQEGWIFCNQRKDYWVLHKAGFSEFFFNDEVDLDWINFLIQNTDLPQYFHVYSPDEKLVQTLKSNGDMVNIRERTRIQLNYPSQRKECSEVSLHKGFSISNVSDDNFQSLSVFNLDLAKKFWKSGTEFIQHALGVFVKDENGNPVSLCYAASIGGGKAEIDIITLEKYRGYGFAKMAVVHFISNCFLQRITPNWDCFEENTSSLMMAKKLNFTINNKYKFVSIFKNG